MSLCDLAFVGAREDPSAFQLLCATSLLEYHWNIGFRRFHHGDGLGCDAALAEIARGLGYTIVAHPPDSDARRAFYPSDEKREPAPALFRTAILVQESSAGMAMPATEGRTAHSETWSALSAMHRRGIPHWLISPMIVRKIEPRQAAYCA